MPKKLVREKLILIDYETRIRLRLFREKNRGLVNFVRQLELNHEGKWGVVVRYDCFHGFFHKDIYSPSGRKRKVERVYGFNDIEEALEESGKDLTKNRKIYIRKFVGDN